MGIIGSSGVGREGMVVMTISLRIYGRAVLSSRISKEIGLF